MLASIWNQPLSVITKICQRAGDDERLTKRIATIKDTYTKGNKGMTIAGTTEFIQSCTTFDRMY